MNSNYLKNIMKKKHISMYNLRPTSLVFGKSLAEE